MIETQVSKGIIKTYFDKLQRNLDLDVAIVGGGPSGIVAAYYLANKYQVDMPITKEIYQVLFEGKNPQTAVWDLMGRVKTKEIKHH